MLNPYIGKISAVEEFERQVKGKRDSLSGLITGLNTKVTATTLSDNTLTSYYSNFLTDEEAALGVANTILNYINNTILTGISAGLSKLMILKTNWIDPTISLPPQPPSTRMTGGTM